MNRKETSLILAQIATYWPRFEIIEQVTESCYQRLLEPFAFEDVEQAVRHLASTSDHGFPPSAPELCRAIKDILKVKKTSGRIILPGEIWERVLKLARMGLTFTEVCKHVKVSQNVKGAITEIGWNVILRCPEENLHYLRKAFIDSLERRQQRDQLVENVGSVIALKFNGNKLIGLA